ncbi:MAG TPA: putative nucleotidyltransferase substrate binding domain-containing protein, partial [Rubrivivax sp.]|nr:putative nucleotidyltransferase substrate binding domain-containing protein [Rubrivivax sp.]
GAFELGDALRSSITDGAAAVPRFHKQLADNSLQQRPPLRWLGGIAGDSVKGHEVIDLKLQGTALFVEAARLLALVAGVAATGTRPRLEGSAAVLGIPATEAAAWAAAFEHLQMLRLHVQLAPGRSEGEPPGNLCRVDDLNELDRRLLRETLRMAARLQQRIELDYRR